MAPRHVVEQPIAYVRREPEIRERGHSRTAKVVQHPARDRSLGRPGELAIHLALQGGERLESSLVTYE